MKKRNTALLIGQWLCPAISLVFFLVASRMYEVSATVVFYVSGFLLALIGFWLSLADKKSSPPNWSSIINAAVACMYILIFIGLLMYGLLVYLIF